MKALKLLELQQHELRQHDGEERDGEEHEELRGPRMHLGRWRRGRPLNRTWKDWQGKEGRRMELLKKEKGRKEGKRRARETWTTSKRNKSFNFFIHICVLFPIWVFSPEHQLRSQLECT